MSWTFKYSVVDITGGFNGTFVFVREFESETEAIEWIKTSEPEKMTRYAIIPSYKFELPR